MVKITFLILILKVVSYIRPLVTILKRTFCVQPREMITDPTRLPMESRIERKRK